MTPARAGFSAALSLLMILLAAVPGTAGPCAWTVQELPPAAAAPRARYALAYTGVDPSVRWFYAFSVADDDLPDDVPGPARLARLGATARPLEAYLTPDGRVVYGVAGDAPDHETVYVVAAAATVAPLERAGARITPLRSLAVGRAGPEATTRFRGATDSHGPLPPRRPAVEPEPEATARAEFCRFRVAAG